MSLKLAYLSMGQLFFAADGLRFQSLDSKFALDAKIKAIEIQQRNEWKTKGRGAQFRGISPWGSDEIDPANMKVLFTSVIPSSKDEKIIYSLETDSIGGIFEYNTKTQFEKRLIHKENFHIKDLAKHPKLNKVLCSYVYSNGISNISIIENSYKNVRQITEGDSLDEAPTWFVDSKDEIVFQSAGIARNQEGYFVGIGPYSIQKLNIVTGMMETILEDMNHDFLLPKYNSKGELLFIKRPYENDWNKSASPIKVLKDFVFFPFRLLRAIFHYLNFFSMMYSQKPLTTADNPKIQGPSPKTMFLHGRAIDIQKAMSKANKNEDAQSLVPKTWKLFKLSESGMETLAEGVASFDISKNDEVFYTDGTTIFTIDRNQKSQKITKGNLIQQIIIC